MRPINAWAILVTFCIVFQSVLLVVAFNKVHQLERATFPKVELGHMTFNMYDSGGAHRVIIKARK